MRLTEVDGLVWSAKAADLLFEHERIFTHARTFTDIRPVFGDAPSDPRGAVVVTTLKIDYLTTAGGEPASFFIGLEDADLDALERTIRRARSKLGALDEILESAGMARFMVEEGDADGSSDA